MIITVTIMACNTNDNLRFENSRIDDRDSRSAQTETPSDDSVSSNSTTSTQPSNNTPASQWIMLGEPSIIDDVINIPGIYIKDGEVFTLIYPISINSYFMFREWDYNLTRLTFNMDFNIPVVPSGASLVVIGIDHPGTAQKVTEHGYTVSGGVLIPNIHIDAFYMAGYDMSRHEITAGMSYETINGASINDYISNLTHIQEDIYHISCNTKEEFIFGRFVNTTWVEDIAVANLRYFFMDSRIVGDFIVERTTNGYFDIVFNENPVGYYVFSLPRVLDYNIDRTTGFFGSQFVMLKFE